MPVEALEKTESRSTSSDALIAASSLAFVAYGAILRLWIYFQNYSLNHDEAGLALNLISRGPAQLLRSLDYLQAAPFLFLLVERGMIVIAGASEYSLRLFPLVCSIAALFTFWWWVRKKILRWPQVLAIGFFAVSQDLVSVSPRAKQYAVEVFAATLLLLVCDWLMDEYATRQKLVAATLLGAVVPWFAFSSLFVIAAIGTTCSVYAFKNRSLLKRYTVVFAVWGISIGTMLLAVSRMANVKEIMVRAWAPNFFPVGNPGSWLPWLWTSFSGFGASVTSVRLGPLAAVGISIGLVFAFRSRDKGRITAAASILLCLAASAAKEYPFANRLIFFLVPAALFLIFGLLAEVEKPVLRKALISIGTVALVYATLSAAKNMVIANAADKDDPRGVLTAIRQDWQPSDKLYLSFGATPPFLYYQARLGFRKDDFVTGRLPSSTEFDMHFPEFPVSRGRVWFMYIPLLDGDYDRKAMERAGRHGREMQVIDRGIYIAKLWDVEPSSAP